MPMLNDEKITITYVLQTIIARETLFLEVRNYIFTYNLNNLLALLPEIGEFMKSKTRMCS